MLVLAIFFSAPFVGGFSSLFWASSFLSFLCCNSFAILVCCLVVTLLSAMRSQLKPRHSSDDYLPVIPRILPPRVTPRVSLAITLTGMGNYKTQESSDLECQGSNQGAGFIGLSRYISVARFSLLSLFLLSLCLLGSRFYPAFQG